MSAPGPAVPTTTDRAVTLADNAEPSVAAGRYTIDLAQEISGKDGTGKDFRTPFRAPQQAFHVHGPRFALDPSVVHTGFPNPGSTGDFSFVLPHVVLTDPTLPWQRTMKEGERFPWMALLVLHESELPDSALTPDGARPQPAATLVLDKEGKRTYSESGTALPDLPYEPIPEGVTNCRTVDLPAAVFVDLTPRLGELAPPGARAAHDHAQPGPRHGRPRGPDQGRGPAQQPPAPLRRALHRPPGVPGGLHHPTRREETPPPRPGSPKPRGSG